VHLHCHLCHLGAGIPTKHFVECRVVRQAAARAVEVVGHDAKAFRCNASDQTKTITRKTMKMRKWAVAVTLGLGVSGAASAATIANLNGQTCGEDSGTWHFVNNQTGGAPQGALQAAWSTGESCYVLASKVLGSTQHFYCIASGALTSAITNLPGKLVLSDYTCATVKVCDPKTDPNCKLR
jgi:hypothetical protein